MWLLSADVVVLKREKILFRLEDGREESDGDEREYLGEVMEDAELALDCLV